MDGKVRNWTGRAVNLGNSREILEATLDRFLSTGTSACPPKVVEIGCGNGRLSERIYQCLVRRYGVSRFRLINLDISVRKVVEASRRLSGGTVQEVYTLLADLYVLPFAAAQFDYLVALNVFYWVKRPEFLREAGRVLKANGKLLVYDVIKASSGESHPLVSFSLNQEQIARSLES